LNQERTFSQQSLQLNAPFPNYFPPQFPNYSFPTPYNMWTQLPFQQTNINPFVDTNPQQTEETVKQMVTKMFDDMNQKFNQKMLALEQNQAQQGNILNQIFTEIRSLKNPKTTRKNNQNMSQPSEEAGSMIQVALNTRNKNQGATRGKKGKKGK